MNEKELREFIGHLIIQMRVAELELEKRAQKIAELEECLKKYETEDQ